MQPAKDASGQVDLQMKKIDDKASAINLGFEPNTILNSSSLFK
jgi:hypothetical protein